jgi:hypothetical protein
MLRPDSTPRGERGTHLARHTKIIIETDSLILLRGRKSLQAICPECGVEREMIPIDEVGIVSNLLPLEVEAWMQQEGLHRLRAPDGTLMLCVGSMLKHVRRTAE